MLSNATPYRRPSLFAPTTHDPVVDHALYYALESDWPVFPARTDKKKSHKSAEYSDGRPWGATKDPDEIRRDFERWPDANVGVVTGAISGIFVVEADTKEGHDVDGIASLAALEEEHEPLPATRQAEILPAQFTITSITPASPSRTQHRQSRPA